MILLHAVQWLPVGSVAYRSHLFSAVCMSAACAVWLIVLLRFLSGSFNHKGISSLIAACCATIAFALTPIAWSQAIITEVYAMFLLLCAVNVYLLQRAWQKPLHYTACMLMIMSLQILHHRLAVFLVILSGILWFYRRLKAKDESKPSMMQLSLKVLLGLSPFLLLLYFPIRASYDPFFNWFNPNNPTRFWDYINGQMYQIVLQQSMMNWEYLITVSSTLWHGYITCSAFGWFGIVILFGWYSLLTHNKQLSCISLILFTIYLFFTMLYKVGDWQVFLLPLLLLQTIPLAHGISHFLTWIQKRSTVYFTRFSYGLCFLLALNPLTVSENSMLNPEFIDISELIATDERVTPPPKLWTPKQNLLSRFALRNDLSAKMYAQGVWDLIQPGDSVVTGLDQVKADNEFFPLAYQHVVENKGKDTPLIGANFIRYDWYRKQINQRYDLDIPMNDDQLVTEEVYFEALWKAVMNPLLQRGGVVTPSPNLPNSWYKKLKIQSYELEVPPAEVSRSYQVYLPNSIVYRLTLNEDEGTSN